MKLYLKLYSPPSPLSVSYIPRSYTCFASIDLPPHYQIIYFKRAIDKQAKISLIYALI
jgi:hypothetical protein